MTNVINFATALEQRASRSLPPSDVVPVGVSRRNARLAADRTPPEELTETARNSRLRAQREAAWTRAEAATRYWRLKADYDDAWIAAGRHGVVSMPGPDDVDDRSLAICIWRRAQVAQILTPAPTARDITWKRAAFASGQYKHIGADPVKLGQAIEADAAWLKAHPTRRPKPAIVRPPDPDGADARAGSTGDQDASRQGR